MTDVQKARIEAAAREYHERGNGEGSFDRISERVRSNILFRMGCALAAADAVVTVEMIRDEIAGHPIGSGFYQTTVGVDEAREIAEIIQRLYRGEEQS